MLARAEELEAFKSRINLAEYAASCGYAIERRASSRSSLVMKHPNGDKLVLAVGEGGHWVYFSVRDPEDNGSIIDFVQRRRGGTLGEVRRELRAFMGSPAPATAAASFPVLERAAKELVRVRASFEAMEESRAHPYLLEERKIPGDVLAHPRFSGRIRSDVRGNANFPHWNLSGLSGFEIKNCGFTGFAPGGEKGLWASRTEPGDTALVIAETAIDALSHFALKRPELTRYVSTAGALNKTQPELLRRAAEKLPAGGRVILATDNDEGGDSLAGFIRELLTPAAAAGRLEILEDHPALRGQDWNDVLKQRGP